jgi:glycosyltransferase involved in cell wall biosynthesis
VSTSLILESAILQERFEIDHLDTSDHRARTNVGRWEMGNVLLGIRNVFSLLFLLRGEPGLVYLPLSQGSPGFMRDSLFIRAARRAGWRVAAHLRGGEFQQFFQGAPRPFRTWIRTTTQLIDSIAVMSPSLRQQFFGMLPEKRIAVVPNGAPDLAANGVPRHPETVLFLSNLRRRKGVVQAIDAALRVLERRPTTQFRFAGEWEDGDFERAVRDRARAAGDCIRFLPTVTGEEKRALLSSSSVFLFPPIEPEGHPRVVLEALSAGLPVVTTNWGAIAETVIDGESGFVLNDPIPDEIADRLLMLLRDSDLLSSMSVAARSRYLEHFTQEEADRRIADWLSEVAET